MRNRWQLLILAVVSWVPLLLTRPGFVVADTKAYLYLDPGRLLSGAPTVWDPGTAMGTVTHQNIGYLWPMGPWFWLVDSLGVPMWIGQRLWLGAVVFAACAGAHHLARKEGARGWGPLVAALAYGLSPYLVPHATRSSVLLLPWAALPWLVSVTIDALRRDRWREPAVVALIVLTIGSINGSSLAFVALGVGVWVPFAVWVHREVSPAAAARGVARIGVLCLGVSAWWLAALVVGGRHGADVLAQSESLETVASGANAAEVWRGLGNWVFYGRDRVDPWVSAAEPYTQQLWLVFASFGLAATAVTALVLTRWRYRAYHLVSAAVGVVVAVGVAPFDDPSPLGALVRTGASSDLVLSLRSTHRAVPLLVLALAMGLAMAVDAIGTLRPRRAMPAMVVAVALVVASVPSWWTLRAVGDELGWEQIPVAWELAAADLDAAGDDTRVLVLPGAPFDARRWGTPADPLVYGLVDRPVAVRELIGFGSPAAAALIVTLDERLQQRLLDPVALAAVARLAGAGDIVFQLDLEYERYRTPRPDTLWLMATAELDGLGAPRPYGEPLPNVAPPSAPMIDAVELGFTGDRAVTPALVIRGVQDPLPIVRTRPVASPLVVQGDASGLIDLAELGLLDTSAVVLLSPALDDGWLDAVLDEGARLVVTDSNRLRSRWWKTTRDMTGFTEQAGGVDRITELDDARLDVFPDAPEAAYTMAEQRGGVVVATEYGDDFAGHPEDRAFHAVDGDPRTAWRVAGLEDARGERLEIELDVAVPTDHLRLLQPQELPRNRHITELKITVNDATPFTVELDARSLVPPGQVVALPAPVELDSLVLEIRETSAGRRISWAGLTPVGLAEVSFGDGRSPDITELMVVAPDLLDRVGERLGERHLTVVLTRERTTPDDPVRADAELNMVRALHLPARVTVELTGQARVAAGAPDLVVDAASGRPVHDGVPRVSASGSLPGARARVASAALDGDPATAWVPPLGSSVGQWIEVDFGREVTFDRLDLVLVADGRHSVPTRLRLEAGDQVRVVEVAAVDDVEEWLGRDGVVDAPVSFEPLTTTSLRVVVEQVRVVTAVDWFSAQPLEQPVGIAELGVGGGGGVELGVGGGGGAELGVGGGGIVVPERAEVVDSGCRDDLVAVNGVSVPVRVVGGSEDAVAGRPLAVASCEGPLVLDAGEHVIVTAPGLDTGYDIDRLVLERVDVPAVPEPRVGSVVPEVRVVESRPTGFELEFAEVDGPFWLVLAQGRSAGWHATVDGIGSLGEPLLVDGFANGWLVDPGDRTTLSARLDWRPQRLVWGALAVSGVAALLALGLVTRRGGGGHAVAAEPPTIVWRHVPLGGVLAPTGVVIGSAVVAGLVTRPLLGLVAGVLALVVTRTRVGPLVAGSAAAAGIGASGAYVAVQQWRHGPGHDSSWPEVMGRAHELGWVVLAVVVVAAVDAVVRTRREVVTEDLSRR